MVIPQWIIGSLAVVGFIFVWSFIAALIGVNISKFTKGKSDEN